MTNLAFNIDFLGKLISLNEQEGDEKLLASSFAWYSDTFMIAVHSKDVVKMQGFCDACMLVLDSIVDHDSTATCQLMISFLFLFNPKNTYLQSCSQNFEFRL